MFRILKYSVDEVSKNVEIKVVYQLRQGGNIIDDGGSFTSKQSADNWLYRLKKDYINIKVENFICHHRHILETSPGHKSLNAKNEALKTVSNYLVWAVETAKLDEACTWLLKMQNNFEKILPPEKNESYESSKIELRGIMNFAKENTLTSLKQAS